MNKLHDKSSRRSRGLERGQLLFHDEDGHKVNHMVSCRYLLSSLQSNKKLGIPSTAFVSRLKQALSTATAWLSFGRQTGSSSCYCQWLSLSRHLTVGFKMFDHFKVCFYFFSNIKMFGYRSLRKHSFVYLEKL